MTHSKQITMTALAGFLTAGITLLPLHPSFSWLILFSFIETLPLFLIGLGMGLRPLYGASAIAALLIFLGTGPVLAGHFLLLSLPGPIFLINRALLHRTRATGEITWYPASALLKDFILVIGLVMLIAFGVYLSTTQGEDPHFYAHKLREIFDPQGQIQEAESFFSKILPIIPGLFALSWGMTIFSNGIIAQGILVRLKKNLRPTPSLKTLHLSQIFSIAFVLFLFLSFVGVGYIEVLGGNAVCVLALPLFLTGFSLVHHWIHKTSHTTIALTLFYLLLIFVWPTLIVVALGILKPWIEKVR